MQKLFVISTGGTIASRYNPETNQVTSGVLNSRALLDQVLAIENPETIEVQDFSNIPSSYMTLDKMFALATEVRNTLAREDVSGVVVTHGTDTLEETSYFLDLVIDSGKPVVITGAQRGHQEMGSDVASNLRDAIRGARHDASREKGVLVVFNQEIHCAREVTKTDTCKLEGFQSPNTGPLGFVDGETVRYHALPIRSSHFLPLELTATTTLLKVVAGMDGTLVECAAAARYDGLILEGFGRGHVPPGMVPSIRSVVDRGLWVVVASRCLRGCVREVYDFEGGAGDLLANGVLLCQGLSGIKARIKLAVILSIFKERKDVERAFHS